MESSEEYYTSGRISSQLPHKPTAKLTIDTFGTPPQASTPYYPRPLGSSLLAKRAGRLEIRMPTMILFKINRLAFRFLNQPIKQSNAFSNDPSHTHCLCKFQLIQFEKLTSGSARYLSDFE